MISGYYLIRNGWIQNKSTYRKGDNLITFNGTDWFLNGNVITSIKEVP